MLSAAQSKEELLTTMPTFEDYNYNVVNFDYLIDFGGRFLPICYHGVNDEDVLKQFLDERFGHDEKLRFEIIGKEENRIFVKVFEIED